MPLAIRTAEQQGRSPSWWGRMWARVSWLPQGRKARWLIAAAMLTIVLGSVVGSIAILAWLMNLVFQLRFG